MQVVSGHEATVCDWLAKRYGVHVVQTPREVLGVVDDGGVLRGAFVVTWHADCTAELGLCGRTSNDAWKELFRAVFVTWGVTRLEVRTSRTNKAIKRAAPKFGFAFDGVARAYYGPGRENDALVFSMTPDQCRWIREPLQESQEA